jgi:ribosomal 50S subunit-associated protein YjgA (DUF615 family)
LAGTPEQFLQKIEEALTQDSEGERQRRMQEVAGLSWESRLEEIVTVVEELKENETRSCVGSQQTENVVSSVWQDRQ